MLQKPVKSLIKQKYMVELWLSKLLKERDLGLQLLVDTLESSSQGLEGDLVVVAEVEVIHVIDREDTMEGLEDMMIEEVETIKDPITEAIKIDIIEIEKGIDMTDVIEIEMTIKEREDQ